MTAVAPDLSKAPTRLRASVSRGLSQVEEPQIDRDGGKFGQGLIRGVSVITRGEALGHGMWIDTEFLSQTATSLNASENGIKARFTHPGLSSDGMGSYLGRFHDARLEGEKVVADMHLAKAGHHTRDGDMAEYVMGLAEEDPEAFGTSIVFSNDFDAVEDHIRENGGDGFGEFGGVEGDFMSPDGDNAQNLPHARMSRMHATDVVDEPAANPDGFFHEGGKIAHDLDTFFAYAMGLSDDRPQNNTLGIDCDRARGFASRFLSARKLQIKELNMDATQEETVEESTTEDGKNELLEAEVKEEEVEAEADQAETVETEESEALSETPEPSQGQKFLDAFGDKGGRWFAEGKSFDEAQGLHVKALQDENEDLKARLAGVDRGVDEAVEFDMSDEPEQTDPAFEKQKAMWLRSGMTEEEAGDKARSVLAKRNK